MKYIQVKKAGRVKVVTVAIVVFLVILCVTASMQTVVATTDSSSYTYNKSLSAPETEHFSGIALSKSELHFDQPIDDNPQELYLFNSGSVPARYKIFAKKGHEKWFTIEPEECTLQPDEYRKIIIGAPPYSNDSNKLVTSIYFHAVEQDEEDSIPIGVMVPAYICTQAAPRLQLWLILAIVIPLMLLGMFLYWYRRRKQEGGEIEEIA